MSLIRISESSDGWTVDYDRERGMYRVSHSEDDIWYEEHWFDAYEDKEVDDRIEKIIEKLERLKVNSKSWMLKYHKTVNANGLEHLIDLLINWIKEL